MGDSDRVEDAAAFASPASAVGEQRLSRTRGVEPLVRPDARLTPLRSSPRLYALDGFASAAECDAVISLARPAALAASGISAHADATGVSCELPIGHATVLRELSDRVERVLGISNELGGTLRFRRYAPGDAHPPHVDNFRVGPLDLVATAMICLTDVEEGGATAFPLATPPISVLPRRGLLLAWLNNRPDGSPDPLSYHEGQPVRGGQKATITAFLYADPQTCRGVREGPPSAMG